jgi:hypothetical protein
MGKGASVDRHVKHPGKGDVIDIVAPAFEESSILNAPPTMS